MHQAECRPDEARVAMFLTRFGYMRAYSRVCMPPMEPPITQAIDEMGNWVVKRVAWSLHVGKV